VADARHELGRRGEALAEAFLRRRGMKTIARNYTTPAGEIDRIMQDRGTVVFVEIKTLASRGFMNPDERVGRLKLVRMTRAAQWFLAARGWHDRRWRFDVVAVVLPAEGEPEIEHFEDAGGT
jgi:putative endonuclease